MHFATLQPAATDETVTGAGVHTAGCRQGPASNESMWLQQAHRVPHLVPHIVCHVVSQLGQQGMHDGRLMEAHVLHFGVVFAAAALQNI